MRTLLTVLTLAAVIAPAARAQTTYHYILPVSQPVAAPPVSPLPGGGPVPSTTIPGTARVVSASPPAGSPSVADSCCCDTSCTSPGWFSRIWSRKHCSGPGCEKAASACAVPAAAPVAPTCSAMSCAPACEKAGWFTGLGSGKTCHAGGCNEAPADCGTPKGCSTCGGVFGRIGGLFGGCRPGLFRDKAYRPSALDCVPPRCTHLSSQGILPPAGPMFPAGHMLGAMPTGLPGPSVR